MYLSADYPNYPAKEWDCFLPQATLNLKLIQNFRVNPKLSAYAAFHGIFDYNKTPLAPIGTRVLVHEKTTNRRTWTPHGTDGWYIFLALENYWCVECYIPSTHIIKISDTV